MANIQNRTNQRTQEIKPYERYRIFGDTNDAGIAASIKSVTSEYFSHHQSVCARLHSPVVKGNTFSINIDLIPHSGDNPVMGKLLGQIKDRFRNYPSGKYNISYEKLPCDAGETLSEKSLPNGDNNTELYGLRGKAKDLERSLLEKQGELSEKDAKLKAARVLVSELENSVARIEQSALLTLSNFASDVARNLLVPAQNLLVEVASDWEILSKQNDLELITDSEFLNMNHNPFAYFKRKYNVPCANEQELQSWLSQISSYSTWDAQPQVKNILSRRSQIEADMEAFKSIQKSPVPVSPQLLELLKQGTSGHPRELETLKTQLVDIEKQFSLGKSVYEFISKGKNEPENFYEVVRRSSDRIANRELLPIIFAKLSEVYIPSFDINHAFEKYLHKAINNSLFSRNTELCIGNPVQHEGYTSLQIIPTGKPSQGTLNGLLMQYEKDMFSYLNRSSAKYLSNKVLESLGIIVKPVFVWS